eukprot:scaffold104323_cov61-Attheya_sp.AAC.2
MLMSCKHQAQINSSDIRKYYTNTAKLPVTKQLSTRPMKTPCKNLLQLNLHSQVIHKSMPNSPTSNKKGTYCRMNTHHQHSKNNTHSTPTATPMTPSHTTTTTSSHHQSSIGSFYPPKDNRNIHCKLNAREKLYGYGAKESW